MTYGKIQNTQTYEYRQIIGKWKKNILNVQGESAETKGCTHDKNGKNKKHRNKFDGIQYSFHNCDTSTPKETSQLYR